MNTESVTLYYREGSSDKVYQASIEPRDHNFVVNFAYGRRGSTMQTGSKTADPVDFDTAKHIYDKLVREKTAKGYTPGLNGKPYTASDKEQRVTNILPQLLNPIEEPQALKLLDDSAYWLQQKFDGRRVLIRVQDGIVTGINRSGLVIGLPESIVESAQALGKSCVIDGEAIGDRYFAFDLPVFNNVDYRRKSYAQRLETLTRLIGSGQGAIDIVETAQTSVEKKTLLRRLMQEKAEGAVFKRHDSSYVAGRPSSGGSQLKFKFYATATCIVAKANSGKRSIALELIGAAGERVSVGNVTIPPSVKVPSSGALVEIRYLYAYPHGSLYQPVYLGVRDDLTPEACSISQLKYKPSEDDEA